MKVSLNWVKQYVDFELPPVDELVEKIGAQLGAVEEVIDLGKKYQGIVIAKVVSCEKHPNADKLSICRIDDGGLVQSVERGEDGLVQVVCGAPNVRAGVMVAWLPPGSSVPASVDTDEPFVLEAREIRGEKSNGMLASPKELALGDSHEGLLLLDEGTTSERLTHDGIQRTSIETPAIKPGGDFSEAYQLDDFIIDIENKMFTHRPDCFGVLGVAREIAGILGHSFKSPGVYLNASSQQKPGPSQESIAAGDSDNGKPNDNQELSIVNELPELVPRFVAQIFDSVEIGPSPVWLQTYLSRSGIRPISNVVDVTNYFMLLTGQPLHAYDYDKVKALSGSEQASLVIRYPKPGEKIRLLNGKEIEPRAEAIMIATDQKLIGLGGVMGGAETEVDQNTTKIILECAHFDMYSVRRTSMTHGLFTDAVTRFNKGQSPLQNARVAAWTKDELIRDSGATPGAIIDDNHLPEETVQRDSLYPPISVTTTFINERLGLQLAAEDIARMLENVEFEVKIVASGERREGSVPASEGGDETHVSQDPAAELHIRAPFWRTDIELREDVVEEVGRLYGFDRLPLELPRRDLTPATKDRLLELKARLRQELATAGANEVLTYSFVHADLIDKVGQDTAQAFQLSNALSPDLQHYRLSVTPSLLDKVYPNVKAGYSEFALFEIGKAHQLGLEHENLPFEAECLALVFTADSKAAKNYTGAPYYEARKYLMRLLTVLGLATDVVFEPLNSGVDESSTAAKTPFYEAGRAATVLIGDTVIGEVGEYKASVRRRLKLPVYTSGFEVDLQVLLSHTKRSSKYAQLSRFPKITQDITLKVPAGLSYQELHTFIRDEIQQAKPAHTYAELNPLDIYQSDDGKQHKHVSLRLTIASYERTLTDSEVNQLLDTVATAAQQKFGAERL